jgi:hypothetical protein
MFRSIVLPGAEHGIARQDQLFARVLREVTLGVLLDDFLVLGDNSRPCVEIGVELRFFCFFLASKTSSNALSMSRITLPNI